MHGASKVRKPHSLRETRKTREEHHHKVVRLAMKNGWRADEGMSPHQNMERLMRTEHIRNFRINPGLLTDAIREILEPVVASKSHGVSTS